MKHAGDLLIELCSLLEPGESPTQALKKLKGRAINMRPSDKHISVKEEVSKQKEKGVR